MGRLFSPIHSQIWLDPRMKGMPTDALLLMIYLMTNHHLNGAGFYTFNPIYASIDLPISRDDLHAPFKLLYDLDFIDFSSATNALLIMDWFDHNTISSSKNAMHFVRLIEQRRIPQNEPKMELLFVSNLLNAAECKRQNKNYNEFFEFLEAHSRELEATLP